MGLKAQRQKLRRPDLGTRKLALKNLTGKRPNRFWEREVQIGKAAAKLKTNMGK